MENSSYIGKSAYNTYSDYPKYSYNAIKHLMETNELIWKLLYYPTADAWMDSKTNLTLKQKAALIYAGQPDSSLYNVFMARGMPDSRMTQSTLMTISPFGISPRNRTVGVVNIVCEVYAHYQIQTLSNYQTRVDMILQQFIEVFNGVDFLGGLGKMYFDELGSRFDRTDEFGVTPFRGKWVTFSTASG